MSPLASSLLALAALLVSGSTAQRNNGTTAPPPWCADTTFGMLTTNMIEHRFNLTKGGTQTYEDECTKPGEPLVGTTLYVCNKASMNSSRPKVYLKDPHSPRRWLDVVIECAGACADGLSVIHAQACAVPNTGNTTVAT